MQNAFGVTIKRIALPANLAFTLIGLYKTVFLSIFLLDHLIALCQPELATMATQHINLIRTILAFTATQID